MADEKINVNVFRFDPSVDQEHTLKNYTVPWEKGMSVMNVLDYIYQNLDSSIAYYDHAGCSLGVCGRCTGRINGKPGLFCQTEVKGDLTLEPLSTDQVLKDLVSQKALKPIREEETSGQNNIMAQDINSVNILVRREIEALIAAPIIKAFMEEFGNEKCLPIIKEVIAGLGRESGKLLAAFVGGNQLTDLAKGLPLFTQGGALEFEVVEITPERIAVNITRCKYAEMYREHGLSEFGSLLSCGRDYALIEGFNPDLRLERNQTIMEGADYCDFCFSSKK